MLIVKQGHRAGFTIVELLIVVVVIAILAAITIVAYNGITKRSISSTLQSELSSSAKKLETVKTTSSDGQFPDDFSATGITSREGVTRAYFKKGSTYCLSLTQTNISYYIIGGESSKEGLCTDVGYSAVTSFAYDTTLPNCAATIQLPISIPGSAPGSIINWGDGTTSALTSAMQSHVYATEGAYTVTYDGPITTVATSSVAAANRGCLVAVNQWKPGIAMTTLSLQYSSNLTSVAEPPTTVTNMSNMFYGTTVFNQPIGNWNVANVTNMSNMFDSAVAFNQPIGNWNTSNVTNMTCLFYRTVAFNQPINSWNTAKVTNMTYMFRGAAAFNQPIGDWDVSKVQNMVLMFAVNNIFNQPIGNWNTSSVTDMTNMFYQSTKFNQDLSAWNVSSVTVKPPTGFSSSANAWTLPKPNWI